MSFGESWSQLNNRRFNLEANPEGINLEEASKKLNIAQNELKSIFLTSDGNKNGVLEEGTTFASEVNAFLDAVNAKFTKTTAHNETTTSYEDIYGQYVTEIWRNGELAELRIKQEVLK